MIDQIIFIFITIISVGLFLAIIRLFSKDDIRIFSKSANLYISIVSMFLVDFMLCYIYKISAEYFVFSVLNLYLTLTAYIDNQTMNVYRLSNIIFGVLGVILLMFLPSEVGSQFIGALLYVAIILLMSLTGGMGKGDAFTLMTIIPYMMFLNLGNDFLIIMLIDTLIFCLLFIVINIRKLDLRTMKLKSKSALTPSIAIGTIIIILVYGFVKKGI